MATTHTLVDNLLATRVRNLEPNPITVANDEARRVRRANQHLTNFSIGEPDFETPDHIKEAGIAAIRRGETRYTVPDGTPELKHAICEKFKRENGLDFPVEQITVGAGAKQVIYNAMQATLDEGDEVVIPAPYWTSYPEAVLLCGGRSVFIECPSSAGFKLTPAQLSAAISSRTKWVILNSPSNPSGAAYSRTELQALSSVLLKHPNVLVLSDDIYEHILYDGLEFDTISHIEPRLAGRTLVVNGVSKTYAMTGWRVGYGAGPRELISAMGNIQAQATSAPCSISQAAAVTALTGPQDEIAPRRKIFNQRRDVMVERINAIPGLTCTLPAGAFYVYVDCGDLIGRRTHDATPLIDDIGVAVYLLREAHVAVVPGVAFGLSPFLRFSYATSMEAIEAGCGSIASAVSELT